MNNPDVIIIGGGAAGAFAAITAAKSGKKALIIEKNKHLMQKLLVTGKGRCNLTNDCDTETLLKNIKTNPLFLRSAFSRFGSRDTIEFFESVGIELVTERGNRVFPASDKAESVVNALISQLNILGVEIITERVRELITEGNVLIGVKCERNTHLAPKVVLCTGGLSYPKTGSTGDGYDLSARLGHTIVEPKAALVPMNTAEDYSELAGLSLKNVKISLFGQDMNGSNPRNSSAALYTEQGELLFTHFGVSGPLVLTASFFINQLTIVNCQLSIDLKPALDEKTLDARLLRDFAENKNKQIQNALDALLPKKIIPFVISQANIPPDKRINTITTSERMRLLTALKGFTLTVTGLRPIDEAIITDGGVDVREINPKTMESKLVKGLYFAGEVIDAAGFTGGFNLQIAFSTAYAAATS